MTRRAKRRALTLAVLFGAATLVVYGCAGDLIPPPPQCTGAGCSCDEDPLQPLCKGFNDRPDGQIDMTDAMKVDATKVDAAELDTGTTPDADAGDEDSGDAADDGG